LVLVVLQFRAFCENERIFHVDAKVADRALDLRVAEQVLAAVRIRVNPATGPLLKPIVC